MGPDDYKKVKEIFGSALEADSGRRGEYVAAACEGLPHIRGEVDRLLASYDEDFMETPAVADFAEEISAQGARSGETLAHYQLHEMIGSGGMGEVYLAEDLKLGRKVAIKVLPDEFTSDEDRLKRFQMEARSASALSHPNIITIYEIGESENTHYIATEYVDGETLRQRLSEEQFSIQEALECGVQLAAAITAAHEAGITHRDIKPENIMIRSDGLLKVLDFGLAKHAPLAFSAASPAAANDEPTIRMVKTEPGIIMGTIQYMSPEQARGSETDARTDIWSLACVLYEMLCGKPPFSGETSADVIAEIVKSPASPLRLHCAGVPDRLEEIVGKALEKNQPDRYQTARDLLNDLKRLQKKIDANPELSRAGLLKRFRPKRFKRARPKRTTEKDLATVSSAEYLIWGIKAHRFTAAGIVLLVITLLGATAFLTRRYWAGPNEARMNYASKIRLAAQALEGMDLQQAEQLLNETMPGIGEEDLRGFEWGYIAQILMDRNSSMPISLQHERPVESVAFSPDGTKLATGGNDNSIHIWDIATGEKLSTFNGHSDWIAFLTFSPDGSSLLSGSVDNTVRLWDVETGNQRLLLEAMGGQFSTPAFIQNGSLIIAKDGNSVRTWDVNTGTAKKVLASGLEEFAHFAISPDERLLAIRMADQSVRIRSASTGKGLAAITGHSGLVTDLRFSPDSRSLITGSTDGTAKTWDVRTGKNLLTLTHSGKIFDVAFSPDGETIATGSTDETVKVWNAAKGHHLATLKGHVDGLQAVAFSPDGRRLASGGGDHSAKIWNLPIGEPRGILRGHGKSIALRFSRDGKTIFSAGDDATTRLWSTIEERLKGNLDDAGVLEVSPDGKEVAIAGAKAIRIWSLSTGKVRQTIPVAEPATVIAYSNDGRLLIFGRWGDSKVQVWSTESGRQVCSFDAHKSGPSYIFFTKDGKTVSTLGDDDRVLVWDPRSCDPLNSFKGGADARYFTMVEKNGQLRVLEVLNNSRSLKLVSIANRSEIASFSGHEGEKLSYAVFSPAGDRLATSSESGTIKIWDTETGQELLSIKPDAGVIDAIAFSPNGDILAAAGGDGTVRLFRSKSYNN